MIAYQQTTLFRSCEFRGGDFFNKIQNKTPNLALRLGVCYIKEKVGYMFSKERLVVSILYLKKSLVQMVSTFS